MAPQTTRHEGKLIWKVRQAGMKKVFIDGSSGTTGLRIRERLQQREDISLITLPEELRHDPDARSDAAAGSDITFLCLPDAAAAEAADRISMDTVIIDTSTVHRVRQDWVYGLPELPGQRERIRHAKRIANPGCHASGFIVLISPLVKAGILKADAQLVCISFTGYSGGGKKMIAAYDEVFSSGHSADEETKTADDAGNEAARLLSAPRLYGITQHHKHLPEMEKETGLLHGPAFLPIVSDFYSGMETIVPIFREDLRGSAEEIRDIYRRSYAGPVIHYRESADENGFFSAAGLEGRDDMEVTVSGNEERILLIARFDNLGKGASGAAIQNMNLVFGCDETEGLVLSGSR